MVAIVPPDLLAAALRPGDVLLVEGESRVSMPIKFLTQSNWSHATLYVGSSRRLGGAGPDAPTLIEADLRAGVRAVPLRAYTHMHTRICRPVGLAAPEIERVVDFAIGRIGHRYDLKNLFDLARYLLPAPPVPFHLRRRLIAFGSGDPSRAICSTLIAQAFQEVRYPILPEVTYRDAVDAAGRRCYRELLHIRDHSLFAPRDFDISPYFEIVKPVLQPGFDPHRLAWDDPRAGLGKCGDGALT
ncbi:MAG: lipo-like protein [Burkholderiales bacterium]|nr:lipo-like protein [Burkholderiales bacterium]